jgi:hypothetical protein
MVLVSRILFSVVLGLSSWTAVASAECSRIIAVGDLHGAYEPFRAVLVETGLVGDDYRWQSDGACLVLLGDLVDRGEQTRRLFDYVMDLEKQADGRLHVVIGNHEIMNVVGDFRYVTAAELAEFAGDETKKQRQKGYSAFTRSEAARQLDRDQRKEEFARSFPPGWFAHREAFAPDGVYGAWILSKPVLLVLDETLFVHGGVEPSVTSRDLGELNAEIIAEVVEYDTLHARLVEAGWLSPLVPFGAAFSVVEQRLSTPEDGGEPYASGAEREIARRFLDLKGAWFVRSDGPLWSRKLAVADEGAFGETVDRMLQELGVERIVVGHTTQQDDFRIRARFGGRVFLTDTGAGPYYGGRPSALEISGDTVRAVYLDEVEVLVEPAGALP